MKYIHRFLPLIILLVLMLVAYLSGITDLLNFETLKTYRYTLMLQIEEHFFLMSLIYLGIYTTATALSLPVGAFLSIAGGFLFPLPWAVAFVVIGSTLGATFVFIIAKTAIGDSLKKRAGPFLKKMEMGFQKNSVSYLLILRLIPIFPFWLVNLAPAFFGMKLKTYIWTTFVGIIPGSYVYALAGSGLGEIFDRGGTFSIKAVLNPQIKIALILLAFFSLIPIFVKRYLAKKKHES